jgi:hypothetical protein
VLIWVRPQFYDIEVGVRIAYHFPKVRYTTVSFGQGSLIFVEYVEARAGERNVFAKGVRQTGEAPQERTMPSPPADPSARKQTRQADGPSLPPSRAPLRLLSVHVGPLSPQRPQRHLRVPGPQPRFKRKRLRPLPWPWRRARSVSPPRSYDSNGCAPIRFLGTPAMIDLHAAI